MSLRNESAFWAKVREAVNAVGTIKKLPAEGFAGKGTPDGAFAIRGEQGIVELKYVTRWPARRATTVPIEVTPWQWIWLDDWVRKGSGRGFVLVGVGDDWFLLRMHELASLGPPTKRGWRVPQAWLRSAIFQGRLDDMPNLVSVLANARATA